MTPDTEKRIQFIDKNDELLHSLNERIKELTCLYEISKLMEQVDLTYEELLQNIVTLIPPAWQYPEITCARLIIGDSEFVTQDFEETRWVLNAKLNVYESSIGHLEIFYREKMPDSYEGPFLKEERAIIDVIAERISRIVEKKKELDWTKTIDRYALVLSFDELMQLHANVSHIIESMEDMVKHPIGQDKINHAKEYYLSYRDTDLRLLDKMEKLEGSLRSRATCEIERGGGS